MGTVAQAALSVAIMFNPQAPTTALSTRSLVLRQAMAAAFKARRHNLPPAPTSLACLLEGCRNDMTGLLGRPGCRDALGEIRALLFHSPGREAEAQDWWHESVASAMFAARVAQLKQVSVTASFMGGLLHRSGEALALKILARVELEHRTKLDSASRREWCMTHSEELTERLVRTWNLSADVGACVVGWMRFGEFAEVSGESAAVYFGRLFAVEALHPQFIVPGALDHAAADLGLSPELVAQVREQDAPTRELIRALD